MDFLVKYGYWVLFFNVLIEQAGLPLPTIPVFLAMGALAGLGDFKFWTAVFVAAIACLCADMMWYRLGRTRGTSILNLLCRISLEPDSCVSNTKNLFRKLGAYALLFAKFVPGLSATAPPLAGLTGMRVRRFIVFDMTGAMAWSASYLLLGYLFRNELERGAEWVSNMGARVLVAVILLLALYIGWKYYKRQRFIRELRVARVTPEELSRLMEAGEEVAIVDLRNALEVEYDGWKLPGAIWIDMQDLQEKHVEIPRDKEVILYCS
jgi:membrane protein DedA with SNARE-associated domain